jgi:thioredoxin 1
MVWTFKSVEPAGGLVVCNGDECAMVNDLSGLQDWHSSNPHAVFTLSSPSASVCELGFKNLPGGTSQGCGGYWPVEFTVTCGKDLRTVVIGYDGEGSYDVVLEADGAIVNGRKIGLVQGIALLHHVSEKEEYGALINADKLACVDFFATWCGPCVAIAPAFEAMAEEFSEVNFIKIDVDSNNTEDVVSCMPTFKFYRSGELLQTIEGADESAIREALAKHK